MADDKAAGQDEADDVKGVESIEKDGLIAWEKHQAAKGGQGK